MKKYLSVTTEIVCKIKRTQKIKEDEEELHLSLEI